jgi:hypothetical protein
MLHFFWSNSDESPYLCATWAGVATGIDVLLSPLCSALSPCNEVFAWANGYFTKMATNNPSHA